MRINKYDLGSYSSLITETIKEEYMTKKKYKELTGEDPENMWGEDWRNILADLDEKEWRKTS